MSDFPPGDDHERLFSILDVLFGRGYLRNLVQVQDS